MACRMRRLTFGIIIERRISQAVFEVGAGPGWAESTAPGLNQRWQRTGSTNISGLGINALSWVTHKTLHTGNIFLQNQSRQRAGVERKTKLTRRRPRRK